MLNPRLVSQHENRWRARLVIRRLHHPPQQRRHSQELKRSWRHKISVEALRSFSRTVQHVQVVIGDHPVKYMILLHIIQKLRPAEPPPPPPHTPFPFTGLPGAETPL